MNHSIKADIKLNQIFIPDINSICIIEIWNNIFVYE